MSDGVVTHFGEVLLRAAVNRTESFTGSELITIGHALDRLMGSERGTDFVVDLPPHLRDQLIEYLKLRDLYEKRAQTGISGGGD